MYKNLALFNGILLAIMIFFNGRLLSSVGVYLGTLIFHILGFILIYLIAVIKRNRFLKLKEMSLIFIIPGLISILLTIFNSLAIPHIGVTLTSGLSVYGQLISSAVIEHFGFFGIKKIPFRKEKILGFSVISLGIFFMIII